MSFVWILILILVVMMVLKKERSEGFAEDINVNLQLAGASSPRKRVMVPLYAPWRMYYPYDAVYGNPDGNYQSSPYYPFFSQYNIYQPYIPYGGFPWQ
ncbi:MAG: hypothetical protein Gaeavirus5_20 [Gaeavirus sp.]|uniref:Uncharacterized protein n=1 Tax=Gaeavirus sp. TaxID=2487767 RepID=A0A3G5A2G0_9VIRU|nr:MAG: hypothetical protein Gaeavirus5_20 [Gaeavirus sp.]